MKLQISSVVFVALVVAGTTATSEQMPTIMERAQASSEKVLTIPVMEDVFPVPISELATASDIIVDGQLIRLRSYISADQKMILTDYHIVPSRVVRTRLKDVSGTPGPRPRMILTVTGGEILVDGKIVRYWYQPLKPISSGGRFLIFARRSTQEPDRFRATHESAGLFEISDDRTVIPLLNVHQANEEVDGVPLEAIVKRIQAAPAGN